MVEVSDFVNSIVTVSPEIEFTWMLYHEKPSTVLYDAIISISLVIPT